MHCPKCGAAIESEEVRFCSRCGFTLGAVRAAMAAGEGTSSQIDVSFSGVNMGVVLMFAAVLPALLAVATEPNILPAAFIFLAAAYIAILLGSGQILKFFQTGDVPAPEETIRTRRKEIAFGSTMMFGGTLLATLLVFLVPDSWARLALLTLVPAAFLTLLLSSRKIFGYFKEPVSTGTPPEFAPSQTTIPSATPVATLKTANLDNAIPPLFEPANKRPVQFAETPSVTEDTTRELEKDAL